MTDHRSKLSAHRSRIMNTIRSTNDLRRDEAIRRQEATPRYRINRELTAVLIIFVIATLGAIALIVRALDVGMTWGSFILLLASVGVSVCSLSLLFETLIGYMRRR